MQLGIMTSEIKKRKEKANTAVTPFSGGYTAAVRIFVVGVAVALFHFSHSTLAGTKSAKQNTKEVSVSTRTVSISNQFDFN
jgi:hypothetical protein